MRNLAALALAASLAAPAFAQAPQPPVPPQPPQAPQAPATRTDPASLTPAQRIIAVSYLMGVCEQHMDPGRIRELEARGDAIPVQGPTAADKTLGDVMRRARAEGAKDSATKPMSPERCRGLTVVALDLLK